MTTELHAPFSRVAAVATVPAAATEELTMPASPPAVPALRLSGLTKIYDPAAGPVLDDLDLDIASGELVSLLGPSGCGKSTLLRLVAGFIRPDGGRIEIEGRDVAKVPTHKRDIAIVHQSHALWPHLTVAENVAFGLEMRRRPRAERVDIVASMLDVVGLGDFGRRMPTELSGGQQQRVALARALVVQPKVLLLDEPLSSLDANLRVHLREEIQRIQQDLGVTTVLVTHDREEAMAVSDRIVLLERGRITQAGTPEDLYDRPRSAFVMGFTGAAVKLPGTVVRTENSIMVIDSPLGEVAATRPDVVFADGAPVIVGIRPDDLLLTPADAVDVHSSPVVESRSFLGTSMEVRVRLAGGERIEARLPATSETRGLHVGSAVRISFDPRAVHVFPS